jgi:hypothetical protein
MATFTVFGRPKGLRKTGNGVYITAPSVEIVVTIGPAGYGHSGVAQFSQFKIMRGVDEILGSPFIGNFLVNETYTFIDNALPLLDPPQEYTYTIIGKVVPQYIIHAPSVTMTTNVTTVCASICCPQRFKYGRWNNTSTNLKLFPSLKTSKVCIDTSGNYVTEQLGNKNIYTNTSNRMSKNKLYSYLSNNRSYLYR